MKHRPLAVELAGLALRELLPLLRKLADWMDPSESAPHNPLRVVVPLPTKDEDVFVPEAWVEMDQR